MILARLAETRSGARATTQSAPLRVAARRSVWFVIAFLFLFHLGHRELVSSHEARAAQNAQRMLDTGDFGLPVLFDGQTDLQKPPGFYWLISLAGAANGGVVNEWVTRLPAALAGLLTAGMVFAFLRREGRATAAVVAAVALATATHFTAISRTARIDVPLTCAITASLLAFWRGHFTLSSVAAAGAVMLKGPVALALLGPVAVVLLVVERLSEPERQRGSTPPSLALGLRPAFVGILVVAGLALPWFVWANHTTGGEFFRVFFLHHNVARFAGTSETLASHPWWYYAPRFAIDFLPWTPALAYLVVWGVRHTRDDRLFRFGVVWCGVMVAVLSAAKFKRADYLLPAFPGAAIALGCAAESWLVEHPHWVRRAKWAFGLTVAAVVVGWLVMIFVVEPREEARQAKRAFAALIRSHAPAPATVLLFRTESHLLAFHLGRPVHTLVEWGELNDRLAEPGPHFVVTPPEFAAEAAAILPHHPLEVVAALGEHTRAAPPRPLVFLRKK